MALTLPVSLVSPFLLRTPIAPHLSAELDGQVIDLQRILSCYRTLCEQADAVIVEGVGGFCVPFTQDTSSAGWIANRIEPFMPYGDENIQTLDALLGAPRLGTMPYLESFAQADSYLDFHRLPDWPL